MNEVVDNQMVQNAIQPQQQMPEQMPQQPMPKQPMQSEAYNQALIDEARGVLGVNEVLQNAKGLQDELTNLKLELTYKDNLNSVLSKNPELTKDIIENELRDLANTNPDLANEFMKSEVGLSMFAKSIKSSITPQNKPDPITDASDTGAIKQDLELEKLKSGKGDLIDLGSVLGKL